MDGVGLAVKDDTDEVKLHDFLHKPVRQLRRTHPSTRPAGITTTAYVTSEQMSVASAPAAARMSSANSCDAVQAEVETTSEPTP
eukprot:3460987-Pleurochrysis_carterae.AAC.1